MIKLLTHPLTKILLWLIGYSSLVSILRASSHTFNMLFQNVFGPWFRFGLLPAIFLLIASFLLFIASVWHTKSKKSTMPIRLFWRKLDAFLLVLCAIWVTFFLLFSSFASWDAPVWDVLSTLFLPILAYGLLTITATEITARLREGQLKQSLYWLHFFRRYPLYTPLGFLFFLLLIWNLLIAILFTPFLQSSFGLWTQAGIGLLFPAVPARWWFEGSNYLLLFSFLTLITLTYIAAHLQNLAAQYAKANEEKIRAEQFKSELITNVSHDIRTPLTSIINYVDLLQSESLDGKSAEYVNVLDRKSARLKTLIGDLMDASKAGTGNLRLEMKEVNLTELIGQVAGEFEDQFIARNLTLVLRQPDQPVFAQTDSRHLWRALENLFSNTAKYTLTGTRIFAEIGFLEDRPMFTLKNVSKDPIDLPDATLTEQFIRGDRARESEGSGLGLYIAKSLVELMDGQFRLSTSGDLFEVEIVL